MFHFMAVQLILVLISIISFLLPVYGYDPLDPTSNITIRWDLLQSDSGTDNVRVSIYNYQQYRHIQPPGWRLRWDWKGEEVIWSMLGAEAIEQGNCSKFMLGQLPHCCEKSPTIIDLLPGTPYNMQTQNCCKAGLLSSMRQDHPNSLATFQMGIGAAASDKYKGFTMPENVTLGVPGYTCRDFAAVKPTRFPADSGRRWTQSLGTWESVCIYSQFRASSAPKCCVSLSAFYNESIIPCPECSCSCHGEPGSRCVKFRQIPPFLQQKHDPNQSPPAIVRCTRHMCPIRVHWHVKQIYREYWRVKITITNFNIMANYSQWNLEVQHPNLRHLTQIFSFNYAPLNRYQRVNDSGMFWGLKYYNELLLQEGPNGNVQSEVLLWKDPRMFTLNEGWAFPRRIAFNGDECVMPQPDDYPMLPNNGHSTLLSHWSSLVLVAPVAYSIIGSIL